MRLWYNTTMNYYEAKPFYRGILAVFFSVMTILLVIAFWITLLNHGQLAWFRILLIVEWLAVFLITHAFWKFSVIIRDGYLYFGFGLFRKKINIKEIAEIDKVSITSKRFFNYGFFRQPRKNLTVYAAFNGSGLRIGMKNSREIYVFSTQSPQHVSEILRGNK